MAVQDPATAAAVMLVALATMDEPLTRAAEETVKHELRTILDSAICDETFTFACWLAGQANDANDISLRFSKLWTLSLTHDERLHFYAMAKKVAGAGGELDDPRRQTLARLKDRLGLFRV